MFKIAPGQLVSGIFCGNLADRYGRKKTLILSSIACGIITFCSAFVDTWYEFLPLKILTGFFDNIGYMASVAYAIEILGPSKREWSNYVSFAFGIGFFLSSPVAYYWSNWRHMTLVLSIFYFTQIPLESFNFAKARLLLFVTAPFFVSRMGKNNNIKCAKIR